MKNLFWAPFLLVAGTALGQTNVSIGINIGPPPPPRLMYAHPPAPGLGHVWVDGYWGVDAGRYMWFNGYWAQPPVIGAVWMAPRYEKGKWYKGYWNHPGRHEGWGRGKGKGQGRRDRND